MTFRDNLPVSRDWLNKLENLGAVDCFRGKLAKYSTAISRPFWARSLNDALPPQQSATIGDILPIVRTGRLGGKPNSPKLERFRYFTAAWSSHPCHCKYRYDGMWNADIGCIGNPDPPLRTSVAEALSWFD